MEIDILRDYKTEIDKNLSFFVINKIDSKKDKEITIKNSIDYAIFRKIGGEYYQIGDIIRDYEANENDLIYCVDTDRKSVV